MTRRYVKCPFGRNADALRDDVAGKLRRYGPWIAILVIVAIAGVMLAGDLHHLADRLATFHWWAFVAALGLALANYAIRWIRWEVYLRDQDIEVPLASSVSIFGAGLSLSITPAKLGELVKSYLLREMHEIPAPKSAPIIVAEPVSYTHLTLPTNREV